MYLSESFRDLGLDQPAISLEIILVAPEPAKLGLEFDREGRLAGRAGTKGRLGRRRQIGRFSLP